MKTQYIKYFLIILFLLLTSFISYKYSEYKNNKLQNKNLIALNDSIKYYKGKNNELIASKLLYEGELNDLKIINNELYNKIENLKLENKKLQNIIDITGEIVHEPNDTIYITSKDSILNGKKYLFDFSNEYRTLEGYTQFLNDSLKISINKDIVKFNYTIAIDEENNVYINSDNPYVKYNNITGLTITKPKDKKFIIGPSISVGLTSDLKIRPIIGFSLTYKLISF